MNRADINKIIFDGETGLAGDALLHDRLNRAMARADRSHSMVAVLDFQLPEDVISRALSERLNACLRATDTVARRNGTEFTIVQADLTHFDNAAFMAQKVANVAADFVDIHIGIAIYPDDATTADDLIAVAGIASEHARRSTMRYCYHEAAMTATAQTKVNLGWDLSNALDRDEMAMFYQPKIDLARGTIAGMEALMRWHHPLRGIILPEEFLPIAEETDMIIPLGQWALRQACTDALKWDFDGEAPLSLAVNVAPEQLSEPDFLVSFFRILCETGFDPTHLEIELSERTIMRDPVALADVLAEVHKRGVKVTVDDFGTGFSSLSHLKLFPVERFKIDKSFVAGLPSDPRRPAVRPLRRRHRPGRHRARPRPQHGYRRRRHRQPGPAGFPALRGL
jgi:EAL domain-containing protein (putative c-di-GMP-specific phosphodiesterase class I)/GGDEF domain-containing protein